MAKKNNRTGKMGFDLLNASGALPQKQDKLNLYKEALNRSRSLLIQHRANKGINLADTLANDTLIISAPLDIMLGEMEKNGNEPYYQTRNLQISNLLFQILGAPIPDKPELNAFTAIFDTISNVRYTERFQAACNNGWISNKIVSQWDIYKKIGVSTPAEPEGNKGFAEAVPPLNTQEIEFLERMTEALNGTEVSAMLATKLRRVELEERESRIMISALSTISAFRDGDGPQANKADRLFANYAVGYFYYFSFPADISVDPIRFRNACLSSFFKAHPEASQQAKFFNPLQSILAAEINYSWALAKKNDLYKRRAAAYIHFLYRESGDILFDAINTCKMNSRYEDYLDFFAGNPLVDEVRESYYAYQGTQAEPKTPETEIDLLKKAGFSVGKSTFKATYSGPDDEGTSIKGKTAGEASTELSLGDPPQEAANDNSLVLTICLGLQEKGIAVSMVHPELFLEKVRKRTKPYFAIDIAEPNQARIYVCSQIGFGTVIDRAPSAFGTDIMPAIVDIHEIAQEPTSRSVPPIHSRTVEDTIDYIVTNLTRNLEDLPEENRMRTHWSSNEEDSLKQAFIQAVLDNKKQGNNVVHLYGDDQLESTNVRVNNMRLTAIQSLLQRNKNKPPTEQLLGGCTTIIQLFNHLKSDQGYKEDIADLSIRYVSESRPPEAKAL